MAHRFLPTAAALIALMLAIAGCGGEADSAATIPQTWHYVALGDSLAVGVLAQQGYVPRYQEHIQTDTGATVVVANLGVNGWQSSDLLSALRTDTRFRA